MCIKDLAGNSEIDQSSLCDLIKIWAIGQISHRIQILLPILTGFKRINQSLLPLKSFMNLINFKEYRFSDDFSRIRT